MKEKWFVIPLIVVLVALLVLLPRRLRGAESKKGFRIAELRCEYLDNPLAVETDRPRLSWTIAAPGRGWKQKAYRIQAASSPRKLEAGEADLWDSGRIEGDETVNIPYAGKPLASRQPCWWRVQVWPENGGESGASRMAAWRQGLRGKVEWRGQWLGKKNDLPAGQSPPAVYLRREFAVEKPVRRALLYATARGVYEARINGRPAAEAGEIFAPGWTDYNKRIHYQVYEVTPLLRRGRNCLGAILGDGWFSSYISYTGKRAYWGTQTSFLAELHIEYEDSGEEVVATDSAWSAAHGPILSSDFQMGETYDARRGLGAWDRPGYTGKGWGSADLFASPEAKLEAQPCPGISVHTTLAAREIREPKKGVYVFDLGQNIAGFVRLRVRGPAGTEVRLRHAEVLNPDGTIYTANLRRAKATDTYILKGGNEEVFSPHFTFHGFRYVEVTGYPGKPRLGSITGLAVSQGRPEQPEGETGRFVCSEELVNRLQRNIVWSQKANFIAVPTDCPQRDERLGWMGDAQIFARTAAFNMDIAAFFSKWLVDVSDAQSEAGAFRDTAPFQEGWGADGAPGWGDAGVIIPWNLYLCYGDTHVIETHYGAMKRWMDYILSANPDFLRRYRLNNNYGDWVAAGSETPKELLATAFWAYDALLMSKMAAAIGRPEDASSYRELFENIRNRFQKSYVDAEGRIEGDTQTGYALGLFMDLFPAELRTRAAGRLVEDIRRRGGHLSTGFIGVRHLLPVLCDTGHADVAFQLLTNTTYPSWGYMIACGGTSIWERWDGWTHEKGFQDPGMNSFNHYAFGAVGEWLFRYVAGIDTDEARPAYQKIIVRPFAAGGMRWAEARYRSIRGEIRSRWRRLAGGALLVEVAIPANAEAEVHLPAAAGDRISEGGRPVQKSPAVRFLATQGDRQVFAAGSGSYQFLVRPAGHRP